MDSGIGQDFEAGGAGESNSKGGVKGRHQGAAGLFTGSDR